MNKKQKKHARQIAIAGITFAVGMIVGHFWSIPGSILLLITWLIAGYDVFVDAYGKLKEKNPLDEEILMTIASGCAVILGEFSEAAAVMVFYQIGELFQSIAVARSRKSVAELMDLRPDVAYILRDGEPEEADPEDVHVGDLVQVNPGERIPVDGVIVKGSASVDSSKITGESVPQDLTVGDQVVSGCINISGVLIIQAQSEYASSTVARILELMDSASEGRSKTETLITRFSRVYTPAVVAAAVVLAVVPPVFTGFQFSVWIHRALNFLVVSCPCALVISVPLAFFGGMGGVSKAGMIAKGGIALEHLAEVDTVVFDKTGTLTTGRFSVVEVLSHREDLIDLMAATEQYSHHPIARAITAASSVQLNAENVHEIPGQGIEADVNGVHVMAGNGRLLEAQGIKVPDLHGATVVYGLVDGAYAGAVILEDTIKSGAADTLNRLKKIGIKNLRMLTGDRETAARLVADRLHLTEFQHSLMPQDKLTAVQNMIASGDKVAFVGDGVNDAPVLTIASVGVAMGGVGSDAAVEASDLVLLKDDLTGLPKAVIIAKRTLNIAKQNIAFALIVKFGVMALSIPGYANMWLAVFADVGVAILCILNSMRAMKHNV